MLNLKRRRGESVVIGDDIEVTIKSIEGCNVMLAIDSPADIEVWRREVHDKRRRADRVERRKAQALKDAVMRSPYYVGKCVACDKPVLGVKDGLFCCRECDPGDAIRRAAEKGVAK